MFNRYSTLIVILILMVASLLAGCSARSDSRAATPSPFPFVTATQRPTSTPVPATIPPTPTVSQQNPVATPSPIPDNAAGVEPRATTAAISDATSDPFNPTPTTILPTTNDGLLLGTELERRCPHRLTGPLLGLYTGELGIQAAYGCLISPNEDVPIQQWDVSVIYQEFERGAMVWLSNRAWESEPVILVLRNNGIYTRHAGPDRTSETNTSDTPTPSDTVPTPPAGLLVPEEPLGDLWRSGSGIFEQIGYATNGEQSMDGSMIVLEQGELITLPEEGTFLALRRGSPGAWTLYGQPDS